MLRGSRDRSTTKNTGSSDVPEHYIKVEHRYNATSFNRTPVSLDPVDDPRAFFLVMHAPRCNLLLVFACHFATGGLSLPASTTYDQRQTGDVNVQVHLKDVRVVALLNSEILDDYTEYDYFYDYADFTLKPILKPTTTTTTTTETVLSATEDAQQSNSFSQDSTQSPPISESTTNSSFVQSTVDIERKTNETASNENSEISESKKARSPFENELENPTRRSNGELSTEDPSERLSGKRYRSESLDEKGRCHRLNQRRLSLIPLVMRLSSKLLDNLTHSTKSSVHAEDAIMMS